MKTLGNILWHIPFLGFVNAIIVFLVGLLFTATVVAAPIGMGLMEFAKFLFAPFNHAMVSKSDLKVEQNKAWKTYSTIVMIVYFPFGLVLCVLAIFQIVGLCITIIGIPPAIVVAKSLGTYLNPVNKKCVHQAVRDELDRRNAQIEIDKYKGNYKTSSPSVLLKKTKNDNSELNQSDKMVGVFIERTKNIIVTPKTEWDAVVAEEPNIQQILLGYVLPLALIPTIAVIIRWGTFGIFGFTFFTYGIAMGLVELINAFLSVLITGFVIDALAPSFGSQKNMGRAIQLVAYSMTPVWIAGILNIFPSIGWLTSLIGLYGLFLMYLGLTPLMKTPEDKKVVYMIVSVVILIAVYWIITLILTSLLLTVFGLSYLNEAIMSY